MAQITVSASAVVHAPPPVVYGILADYHQGHPGILPRPPFGELVVESGGTGAGTRFRVTTRQGMGMITYHMVVTEPEPGRLLVETDQDSDLVSTFRVEPAEGGHSRVTINHPLDARRREGILRAAAGAHAGRAHLPQGDREPGPRGAAAVRRRPRLMRCHRSRWR